MRSSGRSRANCTGSGHSSRCETTITAGVRYAGRDVDQTFGRYLINGTLANGEVAGTNGTRLAPAPASAPGSTTRIPAIPATPEHSVLDRR